MEFGRHNVLCVRGESHFCNTVQLVIMAIRRQGGQATVLHVASGREVIERLKHRAAESKHLVDRVIKKTADSRRTDPSRLRLQIKHLADHPCFPEKSPVKPGSKIGRASCRERGEI